MKKDTTSFLLAEIEEHVKDLFSKYQRHYLIYHNLEHTVQVVKHTKEIAEFYNYNDLDLFILMAAAWFHDTGHLFADLDTHEQKSIALMAEFLSDKNVASDIIEKISDCIIATKMPVHPASLSEKIICDADTYHLGTEDFFKQNRLVQSEMEARLGENLEDWDTGSLAFMKAHHYYTSYCRQKLSIGKKRNIQKLVLENVE